MEDLYVSDSSVSDTELDNDQMIWDDVNNVDLKYIITGNSRLDGMLTTHDYHFKVYIYIGSSSYIYELLCLLVSKKQHQQSQKIAKKTSKVSKDHPKNTKNPLREHAQKHTPF